MAERQFSDYAVSGELQDIKTKGVTADDSLMSRSDFLAKIGMAHVTSSNNIATQNLTVTASKINNFTAVQHNLHGAVNADIPTQKYTALKTGLFRISGFIIAEFGNNNEVSILLYKNGVATSPAISLQGRGAGKPVQFAYDDYLDLSVNDYLELYAYADTSITFDIIASSITVEKTIY